jgi:hypothetical protein
MERVPLNLKVAAINLLMNAANSSRLVTVTRKNLFGAAALVSLLVAVFLIVWTAVDPPHKVPEYSLSEDNTEQSESVVMHKY